MDISVADTVVKLFLGSPKVPGGFLDCPHPTEGPWGEIRFGGTEAANASARVDAWSNVLRFLRHQLICPSTPFIARFQVTPTLHPLGLRSPPSWSSATLAAWKPVRPLHAVFGWTGHLNSRVAEGKPFCETTTGVGQRVRWLGLPFISSSLVTALDSPLLLFWHQRLISFNFSGSNSPYISCSSC